MAVFKVGDEVEITDDKDYNITKIGSKGVVTYVYSERKVLVDFYYVPDPDYANIKEGYSIATEHLKLSKRLTKEEKVIEKIKLMESRFNKWQERKQYV